MPDIVYTEILKNNFNSRFQWTSKILHEFEFDLYEREREREREREIHTVMYIDEVSVSKSISNT